MMLKNLLMAIGLRKAPAPIRTYVAASSFVGVIPAVAYVAWKHRDRIASFFKKGARERALPAAPAAAE